MAEQLIQYAAMVPDLKRQGVVELFAAENAILEELFFINLGEAMGYEYNVEASLGGVGFRALNGEYDGAAKTSGTVNPIKEGTAILGGEVNTDRQMLATRPNQIAQKVKAAGRYFAKQFIDGDTSVDARGYDGLNRRLQNANVRAAGVNGGTLDLDVLNALMARVPGKPSEKRLVMGELMRLLLEAICRLQAATRIDYRDWGEDMQLPRYRGVPILDPGEDESRNAILAFDETRGNSKVTGSIYCARFGTQVDGEYVQGIARKATAGIFETEDQGVRGTQQKDLIEGRVGLVLHHDRSAVRYKGILNALPE